MQQNDDHLKFLAEEAGLTADFFSLQTVEAQMNACLEKLIEATEEQKSALQVLLRMLPPPEDKDAKPLQLSEKATAANQPSPKARTNLGHYKDGFMQGRLAAIGLSLSPEDFTRCKAITSTLYYQNKLSMQTLESALSAQFKDIPIVISDPQLIEDAAHVFFTGKRVDLQLGRYERLALNDRNALLECGVSPEVYVSSLFSILPYADEPHDMIRRMQESLDQETLQSPQFLACVGLYRCLSQEHYTPSLSDLVKAYRDQMLRPELTPDHQRLADAAFYTNTLESQLRTQQRNNRWLTQALAVVAVGGGIAGYGIRAAQEPQAEPVNPQISVSDSVLDGPYHDLARQKQLDRLKPGQMSWKEALEISKKLQQATDSLSR